MDKITKILHTITNKSIFTVPGLKITTIIYNYPYWGRQHFKDTLFHTKLALVDQNLR